MRLIVPVSDYTSIPVPGFSGIKLGLAFVKLSDVIHLSALRDYTEVNVREPKTDSVDKPTGPVVKAIIETMTSAPEYMALKNRGLLVLAKSVEFTRGNKEGSPNKLSIELTDKQIHGLVDGSHTHLTVQYHVGHASGEPADMLSKGYLPIRVLTGVPGRDTPEIADGQNTSSMVNQGSLLDNRGKFLILKEALGSEESEVIWHSGDNGVFPVEELLKVFMAFDISRFSESEHPTSLYRGKAKTFEFYLALLKHDTSPPDSPYKGLSAALAKQLPVMVRLYETIQARMPVAYNSHLRREWNKLSTVGKMPTSDGKVKIDDLELLPFTKQRAPVIPTGLTIPILSGFRSLIRWKGKDVTWAADPLKILDAVLKRVVVSVCYDTDQGGAADPAMVGRNHAIFSLCYSQVENVARV